MQLIEVTDFGVLSAVIWLRRTGTPLRFVLFPMLHLGTAAFYEDLIDRGWDVGESRVARDHTVGDHRAC